MKRITLNINLLFAIILLSAIAVGCAKQGFPSGGPKDTQPPVAGEAMPPSGTTNFTAQSFYIPFDEYVVVKDAENNILISPPMKRKPEYTPKGHGLMVKLKDTLRENTTYLFQFKGAIADLNEGNALESYEYAFSTGTILDSMTLSGTVLDALTLKAREEPVTVMLYESTKGDSVVAKETPLYITRCNKEGAFEFNNIAGGEYRILALEDGDRNMKLGDDEPMAFSDTLVRARIKVKPLVADSTMRDSTAKDSTRAPRIVPKAKKEAAEGAINLLMSKSDKEAQRVVKNDFLKSGRILIVTHRPLKDLSLEVMHCDTCPEEKIEWRLNEGRDSINIWTLRHDCDSINIIVRDGDLMQDTLKMKLRKKSSKSRLNAQAKTTLIRSLTGSSVAFFDTIRFKFENPIESVMDADSAIEVMNLKDSSTVHCGLRIAEDKLNGWADMKLVQGEKYRLRINAKRVKDIYGEENDTLTITTEVSTASQYGNMFITIGEDIAHMSKGQIVVELMNESKKVVETRIVQGGGKVTFEHLKPGKYNLRAIMDDNRNGKWDSGDYWAKIQPERVVYFAKTLDLRANWDMEEKWEKDNE